LKGWPVLFFGGLALATEAVMKKTLKTYYCIRRASHEGSFKKSHTTGLEIYPSKEDLPGGHCYRNAR
jgi:hypothetical protein